MTNKEQDFQFFLDCMEEEIQELKRNVLIDFALSLKNHLNPELLQLLFQAMFRNNVQNDNNCEHEILHDLDVRAWMWDDFLSKHHN